MNKYKIIFESNKLSFDEKVKKSEVLALHEVQKIINKHIKNAFIGQTVWTQKEADYKEKGSNFINHISFYYGDLRNTPKDDWRFCEVKGTRENVKYNTIVLLDEKHGLKQNHIKDYLEYLKKYD
jgi:hypothetical protein